MKKAKGLLAVGLVATMLFVTLGFSVNAQGFTEHQRYVHTYVNDEVWVNWTYVEKPVFPVHFNNSEIGIRNNFEQFMSSKETKVLVCDTLENGTFTASFQPKTSGIWTAQSTFPASSTVYECESATLLVTVEEPSFLAANMLFIF